MFRRINIFLFIFSVCCQADDSVRPEPRSLRRGFEKAKQYLDENYKKVAKGAAVVGAGYLAAKSGIASALGDRVSKSAIDFIKTNSPFSLILLSTAAVLGSYGAYKGSTFYNDWANSPVIEFIEKDDSGVKGWRLYPGFGVGQINWDSGKSLNDYMLTAAKGGSVKDAMRDVIINDIRTGLLTHKDIDEFKSSLASDIKSLESDLDAVNDIYDVRKAIKNALEAKGQTLVNLVNYYKKDYDSLIADIKSNLKNERDFVKRTVSAYVNRLRLLNRLKAIRDNL